MIPAQPIHNKHYTSKAEKMHGANQVRRQIFLPNFKILFFKKGIGHIEQK